MSDENVLQSEIEIRGHQLKVQVMRVSIEALLVSANACWKNNAHLCPTIAYATLIFILVFIFTS
jgi:hypothetical protein